MIFWVKTFLASNLDTNEEKQIIRFINKLRGSKNKLLIFTTREYILNQARLKFEELENATLVKCILDLSKYTTLVKARILYNHLFFKGIPYPYIKELIDRELLPELVKHRNFSPRIIEYICNETIWKDYTEKEFPDALLAMFKSPFRVWEHAFTQQITAQAQMVMYALLISGPEIELSGLFKQYKTLNSNAEKNTNLQQNAVFKAVLKELEGTFIKLTHQRNGDTTVMFHNPSIQDFLINYCNQDETIGAELIAAFIYIKPALDVFSDKYPKVKEEQRFVFSGRLMNLLRTRLISFFDTLSYSSTAHHHQLPSSEDLTCLKLSAMDTKISYLEGSPFAQFLCETFRPLIYSENIGHRGVHAYNQLLMNHFSDDYELDIIKILLNITPSLWNQDDFSVLSDFESNFSEQYQKFKEEHYDEYLGIFSDVISELADETLENKDDINRNIESLNELERYYDVETYHARRQLEKAIEKIDDEESWAEYEYHNGPRIRMPNYNPFLSYNNADAESLQRVMFNKTPSEDEQIDDLFRSMNQDE